MLKRRFSSTLHFEVSFLLFGLFFPPMSQQTGGGLKNYDIWSDNVQHLNDDHRWTSGQSRHDENNIEFPVYKERKGKILSFFYPSTEDECLAQDKRRSGLCLNPYRCHQQSGTSSGPCAHGFGVCCVFTVSCGKEIRNNLTYFVSPQFPSLARSMDSCALTVRKMDGASQLRLDFVHFNLGQPNRLTGDCDSDLFVLSGGNSKDFKLCGMNSGQHIYYDIDNKVKTLKMRMRLNRPTLQRLWEIKVTQIPFGQRAPADCLQYYTTGSGIVQSFNFAENGRHLADQNYRACVRQGRGMCSIAYEPCDEDSFRIGPSLAQNTQYAMGYGGPGNFGSGPGGFGGSGTEFVSGPVGEMEAGMGAGMGEETGGNAQLGDTQNPEDVQMVGEPLENQSEVTGSGDGPPAATRSNDINLSSSTIYWNPYTQFLSNSAQSAGSSELWRYSGYGNYGQGVSNFGRQGCRDRIVTPCDGDEFLGANSYSPGSCDPYHCGPSLCQGRPGTPQRPGSRPSCRIETSATPFFVAVKFGPPAPKPNPEDNIGVCLKFEQLPCS